MTYFLNFRSQAVGGAVVDPYLIEGDGAAANLALATVPLWKVPAVLNGKSLLFAAHGFNVSYQGGACALGNLETYLLSTDALTVQDLFIGVLWPGDFWIPVVNYPFEGDVAIDCGKRLAVFCNQSASNAASLSFVSHSLGARVVLQAVSCLQRTARSVCLTAAAINQDCLETEYSAAADRAQSISILASRNDHVLRLAYPIGDVIADLLHDDHTPFEPALGYDGPPGPVEQPIVPPWQTPDAPPYDHGDYLPPGNAPLPDTNPHPLWPNAADFMGRAFRRAPQTWP
jgi:hypothetical protein